MLAPSWGYSAPDPVSSDGKVDNSRSVREKDRRRRR
jgi:hypothetical protein